MANFFEQHTRIKRIAWVIVGLILYAFSLALFLAGNDIAAGGLSGIAIVLNSLFDYKLSTTIIVLNIPVLLIAWRINGWKYTAVTLFNTFLFVFTVDIGAYLPTLTYDPLVAAVFGGALNGIAVMALTLGRGSTGGTDLICRLLVKTCPKISLGKMVFVVEGGIVLFAMIALENIEVGLYAIITIVVGSAVADRLLLGLDKGCLCMVVTAGDEQLIAQILMKCLRRAVTKVDGTGMYANSPRRILYIAVRPKETIKVKELLLQVDPTAFVMVIPANEVLGGTFQVKSSP